MSLSHNPQYRRTTICLSTNPWKDGGLLPFGEVMSGCYTHLRAGSYANVSFRFSTQISGSGISGSQSQDLLNPVKLPLRSQANSRSSTFLPVSAIIKLCWGLPYFNRFYKNLGSPCHFNLHFPDDSFVFADVGSHSVGQIGLEFTAQPRLDSNSQKILVFSIQISKKKNNNTIIEKQITDTGLVTHALITALGRLRQKEYMFKASPRCTMRTYLKKKKATKGIKSDFNKKNSNGKFNLSSK